ncbi:hypothetical protein ACO0QE_004420 [Hanseniaspora vineae]
MPQNNEQVVIQNRYVLGKEIGKGSFAKVYKGYDSYYTEDTNTFNDDNSHNNNHNNSESRHSGSRNNPRKRKYNSNVAIKSVAKSALKNKKLLDNLEIEIAILKKINNSHIVKLIDCERTSTNFFLIMEYCSLGDLSFLIKKKDQLKKNHPLIHKIFEKYPTNDYGGLHQVLVYNYIQQLSAALKFLRSKNLVHRDIKPQNLLLDAPLSNYSTSYEFHEVLHYVGISHLPILKIADFGFARFLPSTSMAETLCGSPLYMAPEILSYQKYNAKADLWSVGGVLYEMCCGKPPFRANNHMELLKKIKQANDMISFPPSVLSATESDSDSDSDSFSDSDHGDDKEDEQDYLSNSFSTSFTDGAKKNNKHNDNAENDILNEQMKSLIRSLLTYDPIRRISFEEFFENPIITKDLSVYEYDNQKDKAEESIIEQEFHKMLESNLFISEYLHKKKNHMDHILQSNKPAKLEEAAKQPLPNNVPSPIAEESENESVRDESAKNNINNINNNINNSLKNSAENIENEYVVIEKKTVEFNELADEVASYKNNPYNKASNNPYSNPITRRFSNSRRSSASSFSSVVSGTPANVQKDDNQNNNNSNVSTINSLVTPQPRKRSSNASSSSRRSSFDHRRLSISSLNPSNALSKALGIASSRLFSTGTPTNNNYSNTPINTKDIYPKSSSYGSMGNSSRHEAHSYGTSPSPYAHIPANYTNVYNTNGYQQQLSSNSPSLLNPHTFTELTEQLVLTATQRLSSKSETPNMHESTNGKPIFVEELTAAAVINMLENLAAKASTIFLFAEVKYCQLFPEPYTQQQNKDNKITTDYFNGAHRGVLAGSVDSNNYVPSLLEKNQRISTSSSKSVSSSENALNSKTPSYHHLPTHSDNSCAIEDSEDEDEHYSSLNQVSPGNKRSSPSAEVHLLPKNFSETSVSTDNMSHLKAAPSFPNESKHVDEVKLNTEQSYQLATEALFLYLKALEFLAKSMSLTSRWWSTHQAKTASSSETKQYVDGEISSHEEMLKLNTLVQFLRNRFNESLDKADRLKDFTNRLQAKYSNIEKSLGDDIHVEKLIYERALELSKISANLEMKNCFYYSNNCELLYASSLWMLESLLDEEPASGNTRNSNEVSTVDGKVDEGTDAVSTQSYNDGRVQSTSRLDSNDQEMIRKYITGIARRLKSLKASTTATQANVSLK